MSSTDAPHPPPRRSREHRRRRLRRHRRRAYIRSIYFLPSLATLGNAVCGFGAMYVATLDVSPAVASPDDLTNWFARHHFVVAAYLIFFAMVFDALDGRLARMARHTTDFGGQLDSLADVISFGAAPAFLALQVFKSAHPDLAPVMSRLVWAIGALFMSCAAIRLARFNVSNEHGEQHHFSFLGLPSPGAGGRGGGVRPDGAGTGAQRGGLPRGVGRAARSPCWPASASGCCRWSCWRPGC